MINPSELYTKAIATADKMCEAEEEAGMLEDAVDALEGIIIAELKAKGEPATIMSKLAKKDMRYLVMKSDWRAAQKEFRKLKYEYDQMCRYQDNLRTKESTERALAR